MLRISFQDNLLYSSYSEKYFLQNETFKNLLWESVTLRKSFILEKMEELRLCNND